MHLLTIGNLYPDPAEPRRGIFVRERLKHLLAGGEARATVFALRPVYGKLPWSRSDAEPLPPDVDGATVYRVPVPTLPKITNWIDPWLWARALEPAVRRVCDVERRDLIVDGHFLFPDAAAAVLLARRLRLPVVVSARGSDVNVKARDPVIRRWIRWTGRRADRVIAVSAALGDALEGLGVERGSIDVLRNGVDLDRFAPRDRDESRRAFGLAGGTIVLSAGHLVENKGHHLAIEAIAGLPEARLLIAGDGPELGRLEALARSLGVADRVSFLGLVPNESMPELYSAADALVLMSRNEGMPNVVLEALACGCRVLSTRAGGVEEILQTGTAGSVLPERTSAALLEALEALAPDGDSTRQTVRDHAARFGWAEIVDRQLGVYRECLQSGAGGRAGTN